MNIYIWISLGLTVLTTILTIAFYRKEMYLHERITEALIIPFTAFLSFSTMALYLPDSIHIITLSTISYVFCTACLILFYFDDKLFCRIATRCLFLLTVFVWLILFKSTFYIYKTNVALLITSLIIYLGVYVFVLIKAKRKSFTYYLYTFISIILCATLHLCATITLFAGKKLYSVILFIGTTEYFALGAYYLITYNKESKINRRLIYTILLITSQVMISLSCFLMIR